MLCGIYWRGTARGRALKLFLLLKIPEVLPEMDIPASASCPTAEKQAIEQDTGIAAI